MLGLGVNRLSVTNNSDSFSPSSLFVGGFKGAWYDMTDLSTMFKVDGTTPAVVGQAVGKILDRSGNNQDLIQTTESKCPLLVVDSDGNLCLDFDGDDGMRTAGNLPFAAPNNVTTMSVFVGAKKEATDLNQTVVELSNTVGGTDGGFRIFCTSGERWRAIQKGSSANTISSDAVGNPSKNVLTSVASISAPSHTFRSNGAVVLANTDSLGTGTYGNHPLSIGGRAGGASTNLDGKIYSLIVVGKLASADEIASAEKYVAGKTGVTI